MKVAVLKHTRKKVIWPWAVLITLLLVVAIPVGLVYGLFFDDSTKEVTLQEGQTGQSIGNRVIVDSLDPAPEEHHIHAVVTENDVDNLIHYGLEESHFSSKIVKKAYVRVDKNRYKFYADIDLTYFKTRIRFDTILSESGDNFIFSIQEITIGRVGGFKKISESVAAAFINENSINNFIAKTGLSMKYEEKETRFVYKKVDVVDDMNNLISTKEVDLYLSIVKNMVADNMVTYKLQTDDFLDADIDLVPLTTNGVVDDSHLLVNAQDVTNQVQKKLITLANAKKYDPNVIDSRIVFQYLFAGWEGTGSEERVLIEPIDMSLIGITDKTAYKGFDLVDNTYSLQDVLDDSVNVEYLVSKNSSINKKVSTLKESEINKYLASRNIVGYTTLLSRWDGTAYKANYITIDNFYCNLYTGQIEGVVRPISEFVAKININGYHTSMTITSYAGDDMAQGKDMVYTISDVKYGTAGAENMKKDIISILSSSLNEGDGVMVAIGADNTVRFRFEQNLATTEQRCEQQVYENTGHEYDFATYFKPNNLNFVATGMSRSDDGAIYVSLTEGINY